MKYLFYCALFLVAIFCAEKKNAIICVYLTMAEF